MLTGLWHDSREPKTCFQILILAWKWGKAVIVRQLPSLILNWGSLNCLPAWLQIRASCAVRLSGGYFNWTGSALKPNKRTLWRETRVQNSKVRLGDSMVQWKNRDWCLSSWLHPWSCVILSELFNLVEPQGLHLWNTENDVYFKGWVGLFMR